MAKGVYGYSASKISAKAAKRGMTPEGYIDYLRNKQARRHNSRRPMKEV